LQQIGAGQPIWWRASQSPAPSATSTPIPAAAASKARRPIVRPPRRKRLRLASLLPIAALALCGASALLFILIPGRSAQPDRTALTEVERMLELAGFGLTQITLTGHRLTLDSDIFDAIDLASTPTMLSFDSAAAQTRIENLPWVEQASIERVFPDRIEVHITERQPFALWRLGARNYLIDKGGRVLAAVAPDTAPPLPRIAGEGAATAAARLYALLAGDPALMRRVEVAERVGARRWRLRLADGGTIELPADDVAEIEALGRIQQLVDAAAGARAGEIDLRVPGRVLLRQPAGERQVAGQAPDAKIATGGI
jgi:cell division protein FtsQ